MAQWAKSLPVMQETQEMKVGSLGQEDPWRTWQPTPVFLAWTKEPGRLQSIGLQRVGHDRNNWAQLLLLKKIKYKEPTCHCRRPRLDTGEGNGKPLQYSCLENSMNRGACWATVHGVTRNQTWLKWVTLPFLLLWGLRYLHFVLINFYLILNASAAMSLFNI